MGLAMIEGRKQRISDAFGAAADHYDDHAEPQRRAAARIAHMAESLGPAGRILEIGCGTGLLTRRIALLWPEAELIATDLSRAMVDIAAARIGGMATFQTMDGEWPQGQGASIDLILSNLAFQWFADIPGAVGRLMALLRPGGRIVFSTMGQGSLRNWRNAHMACGFTSGVPDYPSIGAMRDMLAPFGTVYLIEERVPLERQGALALIEHLRGIGAVVPGEGHRPLGAKALRQVMAAFDRAGGADDYVIQFAQVTKADA